MTTLTGAFQTSTSLVNAALGILGVVSAGQPPDIEDFNLINDELGPLFRKLGGLDLPYVADVNNIPSVWFPDLADIVAGEFALRFGATPDDLVKYVNKGLGGVNGVDVGFGAAAKSLRAIMRGRPTGQPLQIDYF